MTEVKREANICHHKREIKRVRKAERERDRETEREREREGEIKS